MKLTTKQRIVNYLRQNEGRLVSGSELEDQAREWSTKASVISRRCRELVRDGAIEKELSAKGNVQYRWRPPITIIEPIEYEQPTLFNLRRII